jgi:hypothetical protein
MFWHADHFVVLAGIGIALAAILAFLILLLRPPTRPPEGAPQGETDRGFRGLT